MRRHRQVGVRVNATEFILLKEAATVRGLPVATLVREVVLRSARATVRQARRARSDTLLPGGLGASPMSVGISS